jgi:hypothetical protein
MLFLAEPSYNSNDLTTPDIKWLGVRPSDLERFNIPEQCRLPMTAADIQAGEQLLQEDFIKSNPKCAHSCMARFPLPAVVSYTSCQPRRWVKELELMLQTKEKAEIRACRVSYARAHAVCPRASYVASYPSQRRSARLGSRRAAPAPRAALAAADAPLRSLPLRRSPQYLSETYLPLKLQQGDWI